MTLTTREIFQKRGVKMFDNLKEELQDLNRICRKLKDKEEISKLDNQELRVLFDTRDLTEDLSDRIFELGVILYRHKILI
jgi:hypothetical protein